MKTVKVHDCGTPVSMDNGRVRGTIAAVCIRDGVVTYDVVWWDGANRKSEWMSDVHFDILSVDPEMARKIGLCFSKE